METSCSTPSSLADGRDLLACRNGGLFLFLQISSSSAFRIRGKAPPVFLPFPQTEGDDDVMDILPLSNPDLPDLRPHCPHRGSPFCRKSSSAYSLRQSLCRPGILLCKNGHLLNSSLRSIAPIPKSAGNIPNTLKLFPTNILLQLHPPHKNEFSLSLIFRTL